MACHCLPYRLREVTPPTAVFHCRRRLLRHLTSFCRDSQANMVRSHCLRRPVDIIANVLRRAISHMPEATAKAEGGAALRHRGIAILKSGVATDDGAFNIY